MITQDQFAKLADNYYEDAILAFEKQEITRADLEPLAQAGDLGAALILLVGEYNHKRRFWTEDYEDENTHEVVQVERYESLDEPLVESLPEERRVCLQTEPEEAIAAGYEVDENNAYSEEFREKYINSIGNLMLISGSHNATIGNKAFALKLKSYNDNPLLNQQAEIKEFLEDGKPVWTSVQIKKRGNRILEFAEHRWTLGNLGVVKTSTDADSRITVE